MIRSIKVITTFLVIIFLVIISLIITTSFLNRIVPKVSEETEPIPFVITQTC